MVPGGMSFWLNTWSDVPELTGCCDQGVGVNLARFAQYVFHTDDGAGTRAAEISTAWLQAYGVQQVAVAGPRSTEPYHAMAHPWKFEGKLPELWRDTTDDVIYRVPQRSRSLAHIVEPAELVVHVARQWDRHRPACSLHPSDRRFQPPGSPDGMAIEPRNAH